MDMSLSPVIHDRHAILVWLMLCLQLIALIVLVGGYTRLSGSGLSITEWKPIHGVIPPNDENEWKEEFTAYKATPQYKLINSDMSLSGFKNIFWPEYFHRLLGRIIGIAFALPLLLFALRGSIGVKLFWRMTGILVLGGLQGGVGWIMVKSGLKDTPYVSHTKLALHLSLAFTIFALILWTVLDILHSGQTALSNEKPKRLNSRCPTVTYRLWFALLCIQIVFGGFMAGLHAGLVYNTWPTMNGEFFPDGTFSPSPTEGNVSSSMATNMLRNIAFIQFIHRSLAAFLVISFLLWWYSYREYITIKHLNKICIMVIYLILAQFILGVLTLIYSVPIPIALAHHFTALLLWASAVLLLYEIGNCNKMKNNGITYINLVK